MRPASSPGICASRTAWPSFAKAGFRTEGGTPPKSDVTDFGSLAAPLSVGDDAMRATLANAVSGPPSAGPSAPSSAGTVSVMLDQSLNLGSGDRGAERAAVQALPPNAAVGLMDVRRREGRSEVPPARSATRSRASRAAPR